MLYLRAASITKLKNFSHLKLFEEMQIVVITIKMHQEESGSRTFLAKFLVCVSPYSDFLIFSPWKVERWTVFLNCIKWGKVFKNGPSKICGRQPLKTLKEYGLLNFLKAVFCKRYLDHSWILYDLLQKLRVLLVNLSKWRYPLQCVIFITAWRKTFPVVLRLSQRC